MCHWNSKDCVENMTAHWACFCAEALAKDAKDLLPAAESNSDAWDTHMTFAHRLIHMEQKQTASGVREAPFTGSIISLLSCLTGQNQHDNRAAELAVLGPMPDAEESDKHESVQRESDVNWLFDMVTQTLMERCLEGGWVRTDAEAKVRMWEAFIIGKTHFDICSELADIVTCCQMPWVRVGFTLLLLCGMTLPALMAAFSKFSWIDLVVQLFFAQSYWSLHEMSRAMEEHFPWDLDDSRVAEYQVLGCYLSQLLCLQTLQVQCQSCDCLISKASKLICYLPCLQVACPSVQLRASMLCQQYA
ncbi:TPA: hypothetical protein ACH3X3_000617 [Trebouxia sp. C0006]